MSPTYAQLTRDALKSFASQGRERFTHAEIVLFVRESVIQSNKKLGTRWLQLVQDTLDHEESVRYICRYAEEGVDSYFMNVGGRFEYTTPPVPIAGPSTADNGKDQGQLLREMQAMKQKLQTIEARLVRADSFITFAQDGSIPACHGNPNDVMDRVERLISLTKERKAQISYMREDEQHLQAAIDILRERTMEVQGDGEECS
ncbi:hypothetical protein BV25DRAFT_1921757 [Artomyces pyxidatus]|uniref:Uncharacterized protein n=1 Tax=Artomyces pyxidatus TaxID=48021 RepID=A0ACB8SGZ2_9AGAM|nr:hypothetical protein BV25DRAFT_1921757 [Artomyces pyxidatus]